MWSGHVVRRLRHRQRHVGLIVAGGALISTGLIAGIAATDEGARRSMQFWARAMPVYAHYRATQFWVEGKPDSIQNAAFEALHNKYASKMEDLVLDLRGFYLKLAQVGSTRDEFLPSQYMVWAKRMQSDVPSIHPFATIRKIVEEDLGVPLESVFSEFEEAPLGSASIGQVHKARLRRNGQVVAVKVQYPDIELMFRSDLETAKRFCALAQPAHLPYMNEVEKQFLTEFDYRLEAANMDEIRQNIRPIFKSQVEIPEPIMDLCQKRVLVMEFLNGVKLIDGIRNQYRRMADKMGLSLETLTAQQKEKVEKGLVKRQDLWRSDLQVRFLNAILYLFDAVRNSWRLAVNQTIARFGIVHPVEYRFSEYQINVAAIIDLLLRVHAHEIFVNGCFNGDAHPGNILLLPDGRLGLIDYGQVKRIPDEVRIRFARLIKATAQDDRQAIVKCLLLTGIRTKNLDPECLYRYACFWNDRDTPDIMQGLNIQQFMEEMDKKDPITVTIDDYIMPSRVSILLRGIGNAFNLKLRVTQHWLPYAHACIKELEGTHPE